MEIDDKIRTYERHLQDTKLLLKNKGKLQQHLEDLRTEQKFNSGWTDKGYKGHFYLYFQSIQRMYASEHIITLSSGDLRVSDHPVVVQMLNFTHVLEILCKTGPDSWTDGRTDRFCMGEPAQIDGLCIILTNARWCVCLSVEVPILGFRTSTNMTFFFSPFSGGLPRDNTRVFFFFFFALFRRTAQG
jgi:hypothetical protein